MTVPKPNAGTRFLSGILEVVVHHRSRAEVFGCGCHMHSRQRVMRGPWPPPLEQLAVPPGKAGAHNFRLLWLNNELPLGTVAHYFGPPGFPGISRTRSTRSDGDPRAMTAPVDARSGSPDAASKGCVKACHGVLRNMCACFVPACVCVCVQPVSCQIEHSTYSHMTQPEDHAQAARGFETLRQAGTRAVEFSSLQAPYFRSAQRQLH